MYTPYTLSNSVRARPRGQEGSLKSDLSYPSAIHPINSISGSPLTCSMKKSEESQSRIRWTLSRAVRLREAADEWLAG